MQYEHASRHRQVILQNVVMVVCVTFAEFHHGGKYSAPFCGCQRIGIGYNVDEKWACNDGLKVTFLPNMNGFEPNYDENNRLTD